MRDERTCALSADASNSGRYPGWRRIVSPSRASCAVASTRFLQWIRITNPVWWKSTRLRCKNAH